MHPLPPRDKKDAWLALCYNMLHIVTEYRVGLHQGGKLDTGGKIGEEENNYLQTKKKTNAKNTSAGNKADGHAQTEERRQTDRYY